MRNVGDDVPLSVNDYLKSHIRTVPDWPVAGVQFRDITPLLEMAKTTSIALIMPRSPWLASPGWTNMAGVPVEANVAAILEPM